MGRQRRSCKQPLNDLKGRKRILEIERGSTRSRCMEKYFWKSLGTWRMTDKRTNERVQRP